MSQASNENDRGGRDSRLRGRNAVMLAVGTGLLALFLWKADLRQIRDTLLGAHGGIIAATILGHLLLPWLRARRFMGMYGIRGGGVEIACLMGQFGLLTTMLPARTGEVAFLALVKHRKVIASITEALPRWMVLRVCDLGAMLLFAVGTAFFVQAFPGFDVWVFWARVALVLLVVSGVAGILVLRRMNWGEAALEEPPSGLFRARLWALRRGLDGLHDPFRLAAAMGWSLAIWFWLIFLLAVQLGAFETDLTSGERWVAAIAMMGVSILPIHAPLAVGTMHATTVGILHALGVPLSTAVAVAVGTHAALVIRVALQGAIGTVGLALLKPVKFVAPPSGG